MIGNILEYLEESAKTYPDKIYLSDKDKSITFAEAERIAKKIGSALSLQINKRNRPIVVLIDRDVESILMFLGCLYSGNFYVPINPVLPLERIDFMLEVLRPELIIGKAENREKVRSFGIPYQTYEALSNDEVQEDKLIELRNMSIDQEPACCIFTSGSTGIPKCVLKSHKSIISMVEIFSGYFDITSKDVLGNQSTFDFDISNKDIYTALKTGATIQILPQKLYISPLRLLSYMNDKKISVLFWAAPALRLMHQFHALDRIQLQYLRKVMYSGAVISMDVLKYWLDNHPQAECYNLYGLTEVCKITTDLSTTPIGKPLPNTKVFLLSEEKVEIMPDESDVIGEIYIGGSTLATGYYNNSAKTSEMFVQNPLNSSYPETVYRTGDLAKYDKGGQLIFCGRKDDQIKHMGYRIELGDIEANANALGLTRNVCCLYDSKEEEIVLFYEADADLDNRLRKEMKAKLPYYMVPGRFMRLDEFPLNYHGKVDRVAMLSSL